jgi:hypothetical protein
MQRIDENSYIDDTLVTCAEYQLFIDEMRKQEQYYQPDHWSSYQFPKGQAREPILGVRQSDATAFCEWLTNRKGKEWKFRLPTKNEASSYPLKPLSRRLLGYWISQYSQFKWARAVPENAQTINLLGTIDRDLLLLRSRTIEYNITIDLARAIVLDLNNATNRMNASLINQVIDKASDLVSALAISSDLYNAFDRANAQNFAIDLTIACDRASSLARGLAPDPPETPGRINSNARKLIIADNHAREIDFGLYILIVICNIQERIAGRSPAFEGIRLVKERIR